VPDVLQDDQAYKVLQTTAEWSERRGALIDLVSRFPAKTLADDAGISRAIAVLGAEKESPQVRIHNIAALGLIQKKGKEFKKTVEQSLKRVLVDPLPPLSELPDPASRTMAGGLIAQRKLGWGADYLGRECFSSETPEKLRPTLVVGLVRNSDNWASALKSMGEGIRILVGEGSLNDKERMKRIQVALGTFRSTIDKGAAKPPGEFGEAARSIFALLAGAPTTDRSAEARMSVMAEAMALANSATAAHPLLMIDGKLLEGLDLIRGFAGKAKESALLAKSRAQLMERIAELLGLIALHGATDVNLLRALERLAGSRDGALRYTKPLARNMQGLSERMQEWLREGETPAEGGLSDADDHALGLLLLRAKESEDLSDRPQNSVVQALIVDARAVAKRRGLELLGSKGEVAIFDPQLHRLPDVNQRAEKVEITLPGVVRRRTDGGTEIILQAVAKPLIE